MLVLPPGLKGCTESTRNLASLESVQIIDYQIITSWTLIQKNLVQICWRAGFQSLELPKTFLHVRYQKDVRTLLKRQLIFVMKNDNNLRM